MPAWLNSEVKEASFKNGKSWPNEGAHGPNQAHHEWLSPVKSMGLLLLVRLWPNSSSIEKVCVCLSVCVYKMIKDQTKKSEMQTAKIDNISLTLKKKTR